MNRSCDTLYIRSAVRPRCTVRVLSIVALTCLLPSFAAAQAWPAKPIRMIVPFAAGGGTDVVARILARHLPDRLGQQVFVENRAGANGIVGMQALLQAPPDGYTIAGVGDGTLAMNPALYAKLPYDTLRDVAPVARTVRFPGLIAVHPSLPVRTIPALVSLAKARPGELTYPSGGVGNASHLAMELFALSTGTRFLHVPYSGTGPAALALLAGHVHVMFNNVQTTMPHVSSGKLVALGVGELKRMAVLPNLPTIAESVPGYEMSAWTSVVAPAGTPAAVISRLSSEIVAVLRLTEVVAQLEKQVLVAAPQPPEEFQQFLKQELAKWDKVIRTAGVKVE
jgi:tripartite-type tricarboxylate transporter receptor subunit TctC